MASIFKQITSAVFGKKKTRRHRKRTPRMAMAPPMAMGGPGGFAVIRVISRRNTCGNKTTRKQRRN